MKSSLRTRLRLGHTYCPPTLHCRSKAFCAPYCLKPITSLYLPVPYCLAFIPVPASLPLLPGEEGAYHTIDGKTWSIAFAFTFSSYSATFASYLYPVKGYHLALHIL